MISINQDIRDGDKVKGIFQKYQSEVVFHLAAQPLVRYSYKNPVETYETNVMGAMHVLEAVCSVESVRSLL
jgi:CDP-glucose 4,6-dehydratase